MTDIQVKHSSLKSIGSAGGASFFNKGLILSMALHGAVVAGAVWGMPDLSTRELKPPSEPITVEFTEITRERTSKQEKKSERVDEQPVQAPQNLAREESQVVVPDDAVPTLEKVDPVKATPKPVKKPEVSPQQKLRTQVRLRSKPKPPKRFNLSKIAENIDRSIKEEAEKAPEVAESEEKPTSKKKFDIDVNKLEMALNKVNTGTIIDAIGARLTNCWSRPRGMLSVEQMVVPIRLVLKSDGSIDKVKTAILDKSYLSDDFDLNSRDDKSRFKKALGDSVLRALDKCKQFEEAIPMIKQGQNEFKINFRPIG